MSKQFQHNNKGIKEWDQISTLQCKPYSLGGSLSLRHKFIVDHCTKELSWNSTFCRHHMRYHLDWDGAEDEEEDEEMSISVDQFEDEARSLQELKDMEAQFQLGEVFTQVEETVKGHEPIYIQEQTTSELYETEQV